MIPGPFQGSHLETGVNRRLLLINVRLCLLAPKPLLQIVSAIKIHHSISAPKLLLQIQANMKKQCNINGRPWLLPGDPSSPRYVTRWTLFVRLVEVHCRCVLAQTASQAAPYPLLVVFAAFLGILGGNLTSNPIGYWSLFILGVMLGRNKNLPAEWPQLRAPSLAGSSCPQAPRQLRILLGEGGGNRSALNSRSDKVHLVHAASDLPTEELIVRGSLALGMMGALPLL